MALLFVANYIINGELKFRGNGGDRLTQIHLEKCVHVWMQFCAFGVDGQVEGRGTGEDEGRWKPEGSPVLGVTAGRTTASPCH